MTFSPHILKGGYVLLDRVASAAMRGIVLLYATGGGKR